MFGAALKSFDQPFAENILTVDLSKLARDGLESLER